jgi:hypothetical protein
MPQYVSDRNGNLAEVATESGRALKRPKDFDRRFAETPDDFVFSIKGSRYLQRVESAVNLNAAKDAG